MRQIIDITQLVHWGGNLTGIPRVMNELALRYAKDSENVFVVWDKNRHSFFELDIAASLSRRGEGIFYKSPKDSHSTDNAERPAGERLRKKVGRQLKKYSPALHKKLSSRLVAVAGEGASITPQKGDSLFVLWGEWGDEVYRDTLKHCMSSGVTLVHIVYDMLPLVTPQYSGHSSAAMQAYYSEVIPHCDLVFSISEHTKKDLSNWLVSQSLPVPRIETFRLGDDFTIPSTTKGPSERLQSRLGNDKEYILCVGTVEARKNHTLLYYAYKQAKSKSIPLPKVLIAGRRGWKTDDIFDIIKSDPEVKDSLVFLEGVSDEELSWLYKNCLFTIYPSFYEGWGLPIAESIAYQKVCISSNTSSMPEVAGDLIDYFNPASSDECLESIVRMLDKKYLEQAKKRIAKYKPTTWDDTHKRVKGTTEELYEKS